MKGGGIVAGKSGIFGDLLLVLPKESLRAVQAGRAHTRQRFKLPELIWYLLPAH
jgi:hypothetical protein